MTRRDQILKLIVEHFVKTAEPVGSKTLLETYNLKVSSATIRNEMNSLENDGLLEKTHTSSGRVPSEAGYAYYVEHLRDEKVEDNVKYALQGVLEDKAKSVEEVIKESCEILSHMTNLASVVLGPGSDEEKLASIQLIPLSGNMATAVFVTDKGYVENKTFVLSDDRINVSDLQKMVSTLNDRLSGTPISKLVSKMEAMKPILKDWLVGREVMFQMLMQALIKFQGERMSLYGKEALYDVPEFAKDGEKLRKVLELLDNPKILREAVKNAKPTSGGVNVKIGDKNSSLEDMAIVSTDLNLPGDASTCLTILGPQRMDYDKVVATLKYVAGALEDYFANQSNGGNKTECEKKKTNSSKKSKK